jgi:succinate dehydrogenase / fumarate reductase cytochrome b subunit
MSTATAAPQAAPETPAPPPPNWLSTFAGSSVGGKQLVALTGLALMGFVLVHMLGNLQIYAGLGNPAAGQEAVNSYAKTLKDMGPLLWLARLGLLAVFVLHLTLALRLNARNRTARPVRYRYFDTIKASWASRHMVSTGTLIGLFVVFHLAHYTFGVAQAAEVSPGRFVNYLDLRDPAGRHDVYSMTVYGFRNPVVTTTYVAAMLALALHLWHGAASTMQTLGLSGGRWRRLIGRAGVAFALLIAVGNISMPLAVLFGLLQPGTGG